MLSLCGAATRLCDGLPRREFLRVGGLSAFGLGMAPLLAARRTLAASDRPLFGRAKACIVLWMSGGPPQHETWDPKPEAVPEIRGPFGSIPTSVPGIRVGELMPLTAQRMDCLCILRGVHTDNPSHPGSSYEMMTGVQHPRGKGRDDIVDSRSDFPTYSAIVKRFRRAPNGLPGAVVLPEPFFNVPFYPGQHAGFLGSNWDPWRITCDPTAEAFRVPEFTLQEDVSSSRLASRRELVGRVEQSFASEKSAPKMIEYADQAQQALDLLAGNRAREAFDLTRETPAVRDRYGRHKFGQSCLLARRLVEAGVPLVQVNWHRDKDDDTPMWDAHWKLEVNLKQKLMPPMDEAYSVLLDDLAERGLLEETLVVWMGEFGRTPKLEYTAPHPTVGRNHWGNVFSIALAGAGVRGGEVHGASDQDGAFPHDFPVEPADLTATFFHVLGIDPNQEIRDPLDRPHPLSRGRILERLF